MKLLLKFAAVYLIILAYSCSEPSLVGEELLEESIPFNAFVTDTVTVRLSTVQEPRLKTNDLGNYLLGSIEDVPEFGKTKASIFTQVRLASNNIILDDDAIYDSLVLRLAYNFTYGDSLANQTIKVFELTDSIGNGDHYQNEKVNYNPTPVGELPNYQHSFDSITLKRLSASGIDTDTMLIDTNTTFPQLRIKLDDELGQRLFDQSGQTPFVDNDQFLDFFKGFHIVVDENESDNSLMISYQLQANSISSLILYYHTEEEDYIYTDSLNTDSVLVNTYNHLALGFPINFNANGFNQIINNYGGSNVLGAVNDNLENDWAYIQGGGGLHIQVEFPYIRSDTFKNALINKATLTLNQVPVNNDIYDPPALISLFDATLYYEGAYGRDEFEAGSFLNADTTSMQMEYTFNIPALLQDIIEGEHDSTLLLVPVTLNNDLSLNRAILAAAKLELIYTLPE